MSKIVKVVAVLLLIGGAFAMTPVPRNCCFGGQAATIHGGGGHWHVAWRRLGLGWLRLGARVRSGRALLRRLLLPARTYYYDDYYASNCGWVRVRWRDGTRHRVWRCW